MSNPITILPICIDSTLATIKDLEAKITGWSAALHTPLAAWQRETYALYITAASQQLTAFQQILISQEAQAQAYIAERAANPSPSEPVAPDAFDELALDAYYQERDALEALVNLSIDSEACAGCGALPGDGITASCWHSEGCGYLRELEQRMADRGQYGRNA